MSPHRPERRPGQRLAYLPAVILVGVSLTQITLARTNDLVSWKGGGFGMFTTIDKPSTRTIRGEGRTDRGTHVALAVDTREGGLGTLVRRDLSRVRAMPDRRSLERVGAQSLATEWIVASAPPGDSARLLLVPLGVDGAADSTIMLTEAAFWVTTVGFDPQSNSLYRRSLSHRARTRR